MRSYSTPSFYRAPHVSLDLQHIPPHFAPSSPHLSPVRFTSPHLGSSSPQLAPARLTLPHLAPCSPHLTSARSTTPQARTAISHHWPLNDARLTHHELILMTSERHLPRKPHIGHRLTLVTSERHLPREPHRSHTRRWQSTHRCPMPSANLFLKHRRQRRRSRFLRCDLRTSCWRTLSSKHRTSRCKVL